MRIQIMRQKKGKWYCYFCDEEIKSLENNHHYEIATLKDVDFKDVRNITEELITIGLKWKTRHKKGE